MYTCKMLQCIFIYNRFVFFCFILIFFFIRNLISGQIYFSFKYFHFFITFSFKRKKIRFIFILLSLTNKNASLIIIIIIFHCFIASLFSFFNCSINNLYASTFSWHSNNNMLHIFCLFFFSLNCIKNKYLVDGGMLTASQFFFLLC